MVDNENQWEEVEYSEDEETSSYPYDDQQEYSEQTDDQEYDNYEDDESEENEPPQKKSNPLPILLVFLVLLGLIGYISYSKLSGNNNEVNNSNNNNAIETTQMANDMTDSFFNEAGGNEGDSMEGVSFGDNGEINVSEGEIENSQVATVTDVSPAQQDSFGEDLFDSQVDINVSNPQENNSIMVVYNKAARNNPFKPPVIKEQNYELPYETIDNTQFEIIEPPVASVPDENLTRLLQTQISGILYDNVSPSAIVNLNGQDQFVKIGDTVSGYKIVDITRDKVQISYKNNSYVASVGELFARGNLEKNPAVANLENKFAGRYKN